MFCYSACPRNYNELGEYVAYNKCCQWQNNINENYFAVLEHYKSMKSMDTVPKTKFLAGLKEEQDDSKYARFK